MESRLHYGRASEAESAVQREQLPAPDRAVLPLAGLPAGRRFDVYHEPEGPEVHQAAEIQGEGLQGGVSGGESDGDDAM